MKTGENLILGLKATSSLNWIQQRDDRIFIQTIPQSVSFCLFTHTLFRETILKIKRGIPFFSIKEIIKSDPGVFPILNNCYRLH